MDAGIEITIIGMLTVFIFLTILVCAMHLTSYVICLLPKEERKTTQNQTTCKNEIELENEEIAVAIAAIKAWR